MACAFITAAGGIKASRTLFAAFLSGLLRAPIRFYEQNTSGRILNRCSEDMAELDYVVHFTLRSMLMVILQACGVLGVIMWVTPLAGVGVVVVVPAYLFVQVLVDVF